MSVLKITGENFEQEVLKSDSTVVVDFYADWCGPCRIMGETLENLNNVNILKINVDTFPEIAKEHGIMSIPTICYYRDGKLVNRNIGLQSKEEIENNIKKLHN